MTGNLYEMPPTGSRYLAIHFHEDDAISRRNRTFFSMKVHTKKETQIHKIKNDGSNLPFVGRL
jgi:hypothetical protein